MIMCAINRGYVRNAGVCLHACTCVFVCQHIVPPFLPPWRYKAIAELPGDDKAQSTGKHIFWKMRLIGNLKHACGSLCVVNRLCDHVSCSFRVDAGEAHTESFNTLKETRRKFWKWSLHGLLMLQEVAIKSCLRINLRPSLRSTVGRGRRKCVRFW